MIRDKKIDILLDYLRGRIRLAQLINLAKYVIWKRRKVVWWQPILLEIYTTSRCNLACDMCLTHSTKHDNIYGQKPCKDMDLDTFMQILKKYNRTLAINLVGCGEPFLNKDVFRMAEYASKIMKIYTMLTTNGTLVQQYKKQIVDSYLDIISISINSHNASDYTRITGMSGETFDLIIKNVSELVKLRNITGNKRLQIWASFILDIKNYKFMREMISLAEDLTIDGALFFHYIPQPHSNFYPEERCIFSDDVEAIETIKQVRRMKHKVKVKILVRPFIRTMLYDKYKLKNCEGPFCSLSVDGEGRVGACNCVILDNSKNDKFNQKGGDFNSAYFQEFRNRFLDANTPILEPCSSCNNNFPFFEF